MRKYLYLLDILAFPLQGNAMGYLDVPLSDGLVDLSEPTSKIFRISGEAQWRWNRLITPSRSIEQKWDTVQFPKTWRNLPKPFNRKFGKATYHLRLRLPLSAFGEIWGMNFPRALGASRIWVDGVELPNPTVIGSKTKKQLQITSHSVHFFRINREWVDIIIQNANSEIHTGGFDWDFLVAPAERMQSMLTMYSLMDAAIMGSMLFAAIYHIWLYSFRRKWVPYLVLGLFFFVAILRIGVTGAGRLVDGLQLAETVVWRMELLSYYLMVLLSLINMQILYKKNCFRNWNNSLYLVGGFIASTTLLTPVYIFYEFMIAFHLVTLLIFATILQIVLLAVIRRQPGSLLFLSGIVVAITCALVDLMHVLNLVHMPFYLVGPGLMVFALLACVFQAFRFEQIFKKLEVQTKDISKIKNDLEEHSSLLEHEVLRRGQELDAILQHTDAGVIVFLEENGDLITGPLVSKATLHMMGEDSLDLTIFKNYLSRSQLSPDQQAQTIAALQAAFGSDGFSFEVNAGLLPSELKFNTSNHQQSIYLCTWIPQIEDESVVAILLITVDVSKESAENQRFGQQNQKQLRLYEILNLDPLKLTLAIPECQTLVRRINQVVEALKPVESKAQLESIVRDLHTLKGLARAFDFKSLAGITHQAEDSLLRSAELSKQSIQDKLEPLNVCCAKYLEDYTVIFQRPLEDSIEPAAELIDQFIVSAQKIVDQEPDSSWLLQWRNFQIRYFVSLKQLVESFQLNINEIAMQLGKPTPYLLIQGEPCLLKRSIMGSISGCFVHLLRNALDHGIEKPELRQKIGKSSTGIIAIDVRFLGGELQIDLYDDGRGLDLERIHQQALQKGIVLEKQGLRDEEIADLVFYSGFSTKDEVSDISGRGVGMDAVRSSLQELGGNLQIVWRDGRSAEGLRHCAWRMVLPLGQAIREAS